ncbi:MAG TPA: NRDE family protein [Kofleriaceae bacterium]|nr:NRDE family protein [Kofleriaceae bacterium]
MCTIAIALDALEGTPLAIAANRDELYDRPAHAPVVLAPGRVGGRDDVLGGSWLAFTRDGRFAAVTNQREAAVGRAPRSRGELVLGLLDAGERRGADAMAAARAYADAIDPTHYASANLVFGDARDVDVVYLRRAGSRERFALPRGVTVLANDRLDAPGQLRRARVEARLSGSRTWPDFAAAAREVLADHRVPDDVAALPPLPAGAPVSPALRAALEAPCIHTPRYGTRSSTIAALVPGAVTALAWADGPPCTTPYVDALPLLAR